MARNTGKWGNGLGNGVGLFVSEQDADETHYFQMHPELFHDSYVRSLLVGSRAISDSTINNVRYLTFENDLRGLVSVIADPEQYQTF
jgi:hypothetical protein